MSAAMGSTRTHVLVGGFLLFASSVCSAALAQVPATPSPSQEPQPAAGSSNGAPPADGRGSVEFDWAVAEQEEPEPPDHLLGVQIGGTGYFLVDYRPRIVGPVWLDVGFLGWGPAMNGTVGAVVEFVRFDGWSLYVGAGGSVVLSGGEEREPGCDPETTACEYRSVVFARYFGYGRVGALFKLEDVWIGVDAGGWWGKVEDETFDGEHNYTFISPMLGASLQATL